MPLALNRERKRLLTMRTRYRKDRAKYNNTGVDTICSLTSRLCRLFCAQRGECMAKGLTDKQKIFVYEYLIDFNATQAAIRAGYSKDTAYSIGNNLLKKVEIQNFLEKYQNDRSEKCGIKFDMIVEELRKIGFADIDPEAVRPTDKIKALETMSKLLGFFESGADENIEDISEAEADVFGG